MHIVIVNPYDFLPWENERRGRYGMLSAELALRGHQVTWLTANFHHGTKRYRKWPLSYTDQNVKIKPVPVPPYFKNISLRRVISQRAYAHGIAVELKALHSVSTIDVVVASIPPTESARRAMAFCKAAGLPGIVDMQDVWPKVLELAFPPSLRSSLGRLLLTPFRKEVELAAESAAGLVSVSGEYLAYLSEFRKSETPTRLAVFPLGFDTQRIQVPPAKQPKAPAEPLRVAYIGAFGRFYDLETVVRAAQLCAASNIQFVLIGDGPTHQRIAQLVQTLHRTNVSLKGHMAFEHAVPYLLQSDIGLIPITADWPPSIPNKAFDYLFLGLPVVSSVTGTFERTLREEGFGLYYQAGNPASLANALIQLDTERVTVREMGARGLKYAQTNMDGNKIYKQYAAFVETLAI